MSKPPALPETDYNASATIQDILAQLHKGLMFIIGLTCLGLSAGGLLGLIGSYNSPTNSSLRVTFAFTGFDKGIYPGGTKFSPDDIRAPDVINEAIKKLGIAAPPQFASTVRGAITISGFVSQNVVKERDRLRAAGQTLQPYFPDEYEVTLSLPRSYSINVRQRELLLTEIINQYLEKFRRTYVELPPQFGNAFESLRNADFVEYEMILNREIQALVSYLAERVNTAKQFRSPATNLSFQDLQREAEFFSQIRLNDVLGVVYINGLSKDRKLALVKMDYYLRTLEDQEQRLQEQERVVTTLLDQTRERSQNYVLASKLPQQSLQPLLDQGLIDTLLANDAYNFLVRKALDAGLAVKRVQADKAQLLDRRQRMESFAKGETKDQAEAMATTRTALVELEQNYRDLIGKIRLTLTDFGRQEFGDAIRITMQAQTPSVSSAVLAGTGIGGGIALFASIGLSLLGISMSAIQRRP